MLANLLRAYINNPAQFDRFELVRDAVVERSEVNYNEINCILMRRALEAKCDHCQMFPLASIWLENCMEDEIKEQQLAGQFIKSVFTKLEQCKSVEVLVLLRTVLNLKGFHEHAMVLSKLACFDYNAFPIRVHLEVMKLLVEFATQALRDPTPNMTLFMHNSMVWREDEQVCVALCEHCLAFPELYFEYRDILIDCCYRFHACEHDIEALVKLWVCTMQHDQVLALLKQVCAMDNSKLPSLAVCHVKPENRLKVLKWVISQATNDNDQAVLHAIAVYWCESTTLLEEWIATTISNATVMNQCDAIKSAWMCWILGNSNNHTTALEALAKFISNKTEITAYEASAASSALLKLSTQSNVNTTKHCLEMLPPSPQRTLAIAHLCKLPTSLKSKVYAQGL